SRTARCHHRRVAADRGTLSGLTCATDCGEYRQAAGVVRSKINYATACALRFLRQPSRPKPPRPVANDRFVISVVVHTFAYIIRHDALARSPSIVLLCSRKLARHYGRLSNTKTLSNSPGQSADNKRLYYRNNRPAKSAAAQNQEIAFRGFTVTRVRQQSTRGKRCRPRYQVKRKFHRTS